MNTCKRYISFILASVLMLCLFSSCGDSGNVPNAPSPAVDAKDNISNSGGGKSDTIAVKKDPSTITIAAYADPANLDPQNDGSMVGHFLEKNIYDTLIEVDPKTGEYVPALATRWEWIDSTHLKFTLREGVTFHNGDKFTSNDVLFTFQRMETAAATATLYEAFDGKNSVANGDYEFILAFKNEFGPALSYLTNQCAAIVPADYVRNNGDSSLYLKPMGTGAYSFVSWTVGSEMHLERFDDWWGEKPYFEKAHIFFSKEAAARSMAVQSGDADIAVALDSADWDYVYNGGVEHLFANTAACPQTGLFVFNYIDCEAVNDINVRKAIAHAIDWEAAIEASNSSLGFLGDSILAPSIFGYAPQGTYEYDVEYAKQCLKEAGYEKGLTLTCFINSYHVAVKLMEINQAYLAEIGITLEITNGDTPTWSEKLAKGGCDVSLTAFEAGTFDPTQVLSQTMANGAYVVGSVQDEKYNQLLNKAMYETDSEKRKEIYAEFQSYVYENYFSIPMYVTNTSYMYWDYLDNFIPDPVQAIDIRIISLKTE